MKMKISCIPGLLLLIVGTFISCKKDDNAPVTPDPRPGLFEKVLGKWEMNNASTRKTIHNVASAKNQRPPSFVSIEFLSDTTYILVLENGNVIDGDFSLEDTTVISLDGLGLLTDITFADESLSFNISTSDWGKLSVSANKAEAIPDNPNIRLICRTWILDSVATGNIIYGIGHPEEYRVLVRFSETGTYYLKRYALGLTENAPDTLQLAQTMRWTWDAEKPGTFLYEFEGEYKKAVINELKSGSLKFEAEGFRDDQLVPDARFVFVPAE